ncbi:LEAF RUST 10 DISEASE-RESISTANCE LOCUS RECEPTOR-LIKE PROTEIN KINASE-like 2.1 [Magnolia sinica]|uniref:LEAF RUST 10 DISEASE-RESISTANCE LOCUS RECEPTOR-LIKE PROTEIN KINASE-like 2.1 n=1 Tax=Magnolia sinica TaxID=86752 RepID=UPI00265B592E|nr:LEAF RUST 10 DISEASE-RESISTANCE LOCUS RECEPTOR-LIKE PROTEIN KINASE-like 2.1 [Magnolia sinica]
MHFFKSKPLDFLLVISSHLLLFFSYSSNASTFSQTNCQSHDFSPNTTLFQANLNSLLQSLISNTPSSSGFYKTTVGENPNRVYGLAMCRADLRSEDCDTCLRDATDNVLQNCNLASGGLEFSDVDPQSLITGLVKIAPSQPLMFAADDFQVRGFSETRYGFVQCTRDLSGDDCGTCLAQLMNNEYEDCCVGMREFRIFAPSCNVRYDCQSFYSVLESAVPAPQPSVRAPQPSVPSHEVGQAPIPPSTSGPHQNQIQAPVSEGRKPSFLRKKPFPSSMAIIIGVVLVVIVAALITVVVWYYSRKKNKTNVEMFSIAPRQYKYSDLKKMTCSFSEKLGQGGFGEVFKGKLPNGAPVAVKILNKSKGNGDEFSNEVSTIGNTSHVNIVRLLGFCYDEPSKRALIYEYMPNGSLEKFIFNDKATRSLGWEQLYQIALGIAQGLNYLHRGCTTRILHFDIKPHNILLDEDFCPKISDFGLAKVCERNKSIISMRDARGTSGYTAPEVSCRNLGGVSHKSDVYSYGMMVFEMVSGRKNLDIEVENDSKIYFPHWIHKQLEQQGDVWKALGEFAGAAEEEIARKMSLVGLWCIQTDPNNRPAMSSVVEMLEGSVGELSMPPKP